VTLVEGGRGVEKKAFSEKLSHDRRGRFLFGRDAESEEKRRGREQKGRPFQYRNPRLGRERRRREFGMVLVSSRVSANVVGFFVSGFF
jgi:hypothetical protein